MSDGSRMFQIGTGDSQPKFRIKNLSPYGTSWPFRGFGPRFWGRVQWPPATNPSATGTTPASASASRSSRRPHKRKVCSCRWQRRGGDWLNKPRARESRTAIELVPLIRNEPGGCSRQCSTGRERQNPKISAPTLDGRRCRGAIFWISYPFKRQPILGRRETMKLQTRFLPSAIPANSLLPLVQVSEVVERAGMLIRSAFEWTPARSRPSNLLDAPAQPCFRHSLS